MADAIVSFVVEELCAMAKDEVGLLLDAKKEVGKLSDTFTAIQAVLEDAERQQVTNKAVQVWLRSLKEVAYEVEDIIDELRTDAFIRQRDEDDSRNRNKVRSLLFPCLCFKQVGLRHDIGHRIREITERVNDISMKKRDFKFKEHNKTNELVSIPKVKKRETSSLIDESEIFGRDLRKQSIIDVLISETSGEKKSVSVVSIVGMGGLGKTTLAQLVYNDETVKKHFEKRIWVSVSDPFDVNAIASTIIEEMGGYKLENPKLDTLQRSLQEIVGKTRFLLVLDDVWNESATQWQKLWLPLKGAAQGSKIVITTRSRKVAEVMETTHIHNLDILSKSDCWEVFKSTALKGTEDEERLELIEVGEKIVERCKGVPLALRAVGSLLRHRREMWYWQNVLESEIWEWDMPKDDDILPALLLSYYSLPLHLKRCFSFCSVFPKDHKIKKNKIVKLWMAHDIIKSKREDIEELGESYFDDLLARSLFQDAEKDDDGYIVRCKMHDLVHDLAMFVTTDDYCKMEIEDSKLHSVNCRHLSLLVSCDVFTIPSPLCSAERLRTLLLFGSSNIKAVHDNLFKHMRFLRALDLSDTSIGDLPCLIEKLKHLRYLNLCDSYIKELPEAVTDLCNLQTLELNNCVSLCTLPSGMSKMVKLRHLEVKSTPSLEFLPNGLGRLTSLRTLCKFPVGDENKGCKIGELKNLNLLRGKLNILNLERVMDGEDANKAKLNEKCNLQNLSLHYELKTNQEWIMLGDVEMKRMESVLEGLIPPHSCLKQLEIFNYAGSKFPSWLGDSMFSNLVELTLVGCKKCRLLPGLGKLPSLEYLKIHGADEVKVVGNEFYGIGNDRVKGRVFPKLQELCFDSLSNWEEWKLTEEYGVVMPSLKTLSIFNCHKLKAWPSILPNTLEKVDIRNCEEVIWMECNPLPLLKYLSLPVNPSGIFSKSIPYLPALETLYIKGKYYESLSSDGWELLGSLHTLDISNSHKLTSLPEGLGQLEVLHTLKIYKCPELASLPEGLGQLKSLQILEILNCSQLSSLPEGLGHLKALLALKIYNCSQLSFLPEGLGQLKAFQTLEIFNCSQLLSLPEGLGQLKTLQILQIFGCSQLSSLPDGLGQLEALRFLDICACNGLQSLPNGLGQLKSLRRLHVFDCPNLKPLPNLRHLTTLQRLNITKCPLASERLEKEKGADWCNISHIPYIVINQQRIQ